MTLDMIVPCYNEAEVLRTFYAEANRVSALLEGVETTFLFINDGSKDDTLKIIRELAAQDPRVKYVSLSRNFGKEAAMYAGLQNSRGELVAVLDADLQDPPALLLDMLKAIREEGIDMCATRRSTRTGEPPIRSYFARKFYQVINKMSNVGVVDGARDFRLMTRQVVDAILSLCEVERFSKGIFSWVGFDTKWFDYENIERAGGTTKWSFWKLFKYAVSGIVAFSTVPLRFAIFMGFLVSISAFIYLVYILLRVVTHGTAISGYASTIAVLLFSSGVTMLSLGVLGEYLSRAYMEVKRRPIYITKEKNF